MNERIKLLAEQAEMSVKWGDPNNYDDYHRAMDEWQEKFAELIVKECAELSVNSQYANTKREYYEGFNEALIYVGNKIKTHFGVEE